MDNIIEDVEARSAKSWSICRNLVPKEEIIYFTQVILIYAIVISCVVNLSFGSTRHDVLWSSLLSGSLGYLLPSPKLESKKVVTENESILHNASE